MNVTLSVDGQLVARARKKAAALGKGLNPRWPAGRVHGFSFWDAPILRAAASRGCGW